MKKSIDSVNKRRDRVFSEILKHEEMEVNTLAEMLDVSPLTIRRDLEFFERKKLVKRFYGGVRLSNPYDEDSPNQRIEIIKQALAHKASEFINSGDIVFINTSTTVLNILEYLDTKEITIVTNFGKAIQASKRSNATIILTGGELRSPKDTMVGDYALQMLQTIRSSITLLGCSGFSIENGMSTSIHSEVSVNKKMIEQTNGNIFVIADHTKINSDAAFIVADTQEINGLITDSEIDSETRERLSRIPNFSLIVVEAHEINALRNYL